MSLPRGLLPIFLVSLEIEIPKATHFIGASVPCAAAVAGQAIGDDEEEDHIEQGSTKEYRKRQKQVSI
ncbi:hypothetical protein N9U65_03330, partial [Planctomycetaceae bacterium]|nr:hypothetical protein [Planctomycetaceae bacterium]